MSKPNKDPKDLELLAAAEHESWSNWMRYLHPKIMSEFAFAGHLLSATNEEDAAILCQEFEALPSVRRYIRQMNTPYKDLSEKEKESDRIEARKKLAIYRPEGSIIARTAATVDLDCFPSNTVNDPGSLALVLAEMTFLDIQEEVIQRCPGYEQGESISCSNCGMAHEPEEES